MSSSEHSSLTGRVPKIWRDGNRDQLYDFWGLSSLFCRIEFPLCSFDYTHSIPESSLFSIRVGFWPEKKKSRDQYKRLGSFEVGRDSAQVVRLTFPAFPMMQVMIFMDELSSDWSQKRSWSRSLPIETDSTVSIRFRPQRIEIAHVPSRKIIPQNKPSQSRDQKKISKFLNSICKGSH